MCRLNEIEEVLNCPMVRNDVNATTVGEYLKTLLLTLWDEAEGFNGKRPFGNSDWQWTVYISLAKAGLVNGVVFDEDGYVDEFPYEERLLADQLIKDAIRSL